MLKLMCLFLLLSKNISAENLSDEYVDPVIDFLLNGNSQSDENVTEDEPRNVTAGIWKCGNCTDLDDSKIVYSEQNYIEADENDPGYEETKIELVLDGMRCVTVSADTPGPVTRLTGACDGAVTLYMTRVRHFVLQVYV